MDKKEVLLICGGGSSEHEISLKSAQFIYKKLNSIDDINIHFITIEKDGSRIDRNGSTCELRRAGEIHYLKSNRTIKLDYAIPCIHGPPGENGQIQAIFEMMGLPFLGASFESSTYCFNKVATKLWLSSANIPNTEYLVLNKFDQNNDQKRCHDFFNDHGKNIFVKAASQGSSIGCYHITNADKINSAIEQAFQYSKYVLVEKTIIARELEVAVFTYKNKTYVTDPGEVICPDQFYDYQQKYDSASNTKIEVCAKNIENGQLKKIKKYALEAFEFLNIKDMARVDFFLTDDGNIIVNEINTFPGHTEISLFPRMLENTQIKYSEFLADKIFSS